MKELTKMLLEERKKLNMNYNLCKKKYELLKISEYKDKELKLELERLYGLTHGVSDLLITIEFWFEKKEPKEFNKYLKQRNYDTDIDVSRL